MRYPCSPLRPTCFSYYFTFLWLLFLLTNTPTPRAAEPFLREWTPCTPSDRNFPAMVEFNHEYWIFGGKSTNIYRSGWPLNDVWKCSSLADWQQVTPAAPFSPRSKAKALVINHKIWLVGGEDRSGKLCNDLWITSDGIHWTSHTLRYWTSGANVFVFKNMLAVNARGVCVATQDGDTWQYYSSPYTGFFCFNEDTLYGFQWKTSSLILGYRSTNGLDWSMFTMAYRPPTTDFFGSSCTINGLSYYCSPDNHFYSTTDGENWKTLGTFTPPGLATTQTLLLTQNGRFKMSDGLSQLWTSTDTLHWQNISDRLPPTTAPCYAQNDRGQTLAIVNVSGTLRVFRSTDSCHWQAIGELSTSSQYNSLTLTWFKGAYYLLNNFEPGIIRRSTDGRSWPIVAEFDTMTYWNSIYPFTLGDRLYISGYVQGYWKFFSSTDGILWDEFPGALLYRNVGCPPLEYKGRIWALAKPDITTWSLISSNDMTHWTTHTLPTFSGWPLALEVLRDKFVLISELGAYTSTDASHWEKQYAFPPLEMDLDYIMCLPAPRGLYLYSFDLSYSRYITRQAWFTPFQANAAAPAWNLYP